MKILYVKSFSEATYWINRYKIKIAYLNTIKCKLFSLIAKVRFRFFFRIIDAYFESALRAMGTVCEVGVDDLKRIDPCLFDLTVIHHRCDGKVTQHDEGFLREIALSIRSKFKILYINDDFPETMNSNDVLNVFDLIVKREPYKDLSRYSISEQNRAKIIPTMLSCPLYSLRKGHSLKIKKHVFQVLKNKQPKKNDIFFIGKATDERLDIWRTLKGKYNCSGGLLVRVGFTEGEDELYCSGLKFDEYLRQITGAKIALAIGGHGPFTFRHLEILAAGSFLICSKKLEEIALPIELVDGQHYVSYSDKNDLLKKIAYYLKNDEEREKIANQGRDYFKESYNPNKHGQFLENQIKRHISILD